MTTAVHSVVRALLMALLLHFSGTSVAQSPAIDALKAELAQAERRGGPVSEDVAMALTQLGGAYHSADQLALAEAQFQRALLILERLFGANHPAVASTLNNIAGTYLDQGRFADALPLYQRSLAIREAVLDPKSRQIAMTHANLYRSYDGLRQYAAAETHVQRAIELFDYNKDVENSAKLRVKLNELRAKRSSSPVADTAAAPAADLTNQPTFLSMNNALAADEPSYLAMYDSMAKPPMAERTAQYYAKLIGLPADVRPVAKLKLCPECRLRVSLYCNSHVAFHNTASLQGKKVRIGTSSPTHKALTALNAQPQVVAVAHVADALRQGVLDCIAIEDLG